MNEQSEQGRCRDDKGGARTGKADHATQERFQEAGIRLNAEIEDGEHEHPRDRRNFRDPSHHKSGGRCAEATEQCCCHRYENKGSDRRQPIQKDRREQDGDGQHA